MEDNRWLILEEVLCKWQLRWIQTTWADRIRMHWTWPTSTRKSSFLFDSLNLAGCQHNCFGIIPFRQQLLNKFRYFLLWKLYMWCTFKLKSQAFIAPPTRHDSGLLPWKLNGGQWTELNWNPILYCFIFLYCLFLIYMEIKKSLSQIPI